ncbi:MAG: DUF2493 domain-containing protein [Ruminococcus sp.]|nr:DUF2493 domain-containing protein [Ruminococcus sp.]
MIHKIAIGGCRNFHSYTILKRYVDIYLSDIKHTGEITIFSGHCSGTDALAERNAEENNYSLELFPAQWNKYGRSAGPIRNEIMVAKCDYVIAFWDGTSKGTKNLIDNAVKYNKPLRVKLIDTEKPPG